jgi:hypothetical protein
MKRAEPSRLNYAPEYKTLTTGTLNSQEKASHHQSKYQSGNEPEMLKSNLTKQRGKCGKTRRVLRFLETKLCAKEKPDENEQTPLSLKKQEKQRCKENRKKKDRKHFPLPNLYALWMS